MGRVLRTIHMGRSGGRSADGREKFGTYTRDAVGQDYADQRYYGVGTGRFGTPDPMHSAALGDPGSWNQYSYVGGDPLNFSDPGGSNRLACDQYTLEGPCVGQSLGGGGVTWFTNFWWSPEGGLVAIATSSYGSPESATDPQGTSGSGGPPNKGGYYTNAASTGKTAWQYLTSSWSNCLNDFKQLQGFDASAFQTLLTSGMTFLDTRDSAIGARVVDSYAHDGDMTTLASLFTNVEGNVAVTLSGTHYVALGADYFTDETQTQQIGIAIHEALHMTFPTLSDAGLAATLMQFGFKPSVDPSSSRFNSQEITDWIVGSADHMSTASGGCRNPGAR